MTYLDKQSSLSCSHTLRYGYTPQSSSPCPSAAFSFFKSPFLFSSPPSPPTRVSSVSVITCFPPPPPPTPPPAFKLVLLLLLLLSLRLSCHFHRTWSKVESRIIQMRQRCRSQERAQKKQSLYLPAAPECAACRAESEERTNI